LNASKNSSNILLSIDILVVVIAMISRLRSFQGSQRFCFFWKDYFISIIILNMTVRNVPLTYHD